MRREGVGLMREQPLLERVRSLGKSGHTTTNYLRLIGNSFILNP
jgi:hypothetical protein